MLMLSSVLLDETTPIHIRNAAGIALKNGLTARVRVFVLLISDNDSPTYSGFYLPRFSQEAARQSELSNRWFALPVDAKDRIKQEILMTLHSPQPKAGSFASQVVAAIAAVEIPQN